MWLIHHVRHHKVVLNKESLGSVLPEPGEMRGLCQEEHLMENLCHTPWEIGEQLKVPLHEYNFSVKGCSIIVLEFYAWNFAFVMRLC